MSVLFIVVVAVCLLLLFVVLKVYIVTHLGVSFHLLLVWVAFTNAPCGELCKHSRPQVCVI